MRRPVIDPDPPVVALLQLPAVSPVPVFTAVSVQLMGPQGARDTLPVIAVEPPPMVVCMLPSMQSMSPRISDVPLAARPVCEMAISHVPLTAPVGSLPCH